MDRRTTLRTIVPMLTALLVASCAGTSATAHGSVPHPPRHIALLFFSDAHGDLETHTELFWQRDGTRELAQAGGYPRLAAAVNDARRELHGNAFLVDGGDTFQGAAAAAWSEGEAIIGPQNALGVDVGIPGNWEVVYGAQRMRDLLGRLNYPVLAANVFDASTGARVFPASVVREHAGVRVAFIGYTDPDVPQRQSPSYSRGLRYGGVETLPSVIAHARDAEHADLVVLTTHIGLARSLALAEELHGVDVILSGDSHERTYAPVMRNGVLVVEPGSFASFLGRLDVQFDDGSRRPRFAWTLKELRADRVPEDAAMRAEVERSLAPYRSRLDVVLGATDAPLERYGVVETNADDMLADAVRESTGTDIALSNGFRFGHPIPAGPIRERDLWMLYPITSRVKTGTVTGAQLRAFWESEIDHVFATDPRRLFGGWLPRVSGMSVRFRADAPAGARVLSILVHGEPLDPARRYSVTACEREGDADDTLCRMRGVADATVAAIDNHQVVRAYLAHHPHLAASEERRVEAVDRPERMYSQFIP